MMVFWSRRSRCNRWRERERLASNKQEEGEAMEDGWDGQGGEGEAPVFTIYYRFHPISERERGREIGGSLAFFVVVCSMFVSSRVGRERKRR